MYIHSSIHWSNEKPKLNDKLAQITWLQSIDQGHVTYYLSWPCMYYHLHVYFHRLIIGTFTISATIWPLQNFGWWKFGKNFGLLWARSFNNLELGKSILLSYFSSISFWHISLTWSGYCCQFIECYVFIIYLPMHFWLFFGTIKNCYEKGFKNVCNESTG